MFVEFTKDKDDIDSLGEESHHSTSSTATEHTANFVPCSREHLVNLNRSVRKNHWTKIPVPRRSITQKVHNYDSGLVPRNDLVQPNNKNADSSSSNNYMMGLPNLTKKRRKKMPYFSVALTGILVVLMLMMVGFDDNLSSILFGSMNQSRLSCISGKIRNRLMLSTSFGGNVDSRRYLCDEGTESEDDPIIAGAAAMKHKSYKETRKPDEENNSKNEESIFSRLKSTLMKLTSGHGLRRQSKKNEYPLPSREKKPLCNNDDNENKETNFVTDQNRRMILTTSRSIILDTNENITEVHSCISGSIIDIGFEAPINLLFVIDRSENSKSVFPGAWMGDLNNDGLRNSILDAQIAIVIKALETILDSKGYLNNDNVRVGLVSYSTMGRYHGMYPPLDPTNPSAINPELLTDLTSITSQGWCNYDDALKKGNEFFEHDALKEGKNNIMYFFAAGLPDTTLDSEGDIPKAVPVTDENTNERMPLQSEMLRKAEMLKSDAYNVERYAIDLGLPGDDRTNHHLAKIDNTPTSRGDHPGAERVYTYTGLERVVFSPSDFFELKDFALYVENNRDYNLTTGEGLVAGPMGYTFHNHIISTTASKDAKINIRIEATLDEQHDGKKMTVENIITTKHLVSVTDTHTGGSVGQSLMEE